MHQLNNQSVVELTVEEMTAANGGTTDPISDFIRLLMGGNPVMPAPV